jgi:hypothetical protein
MAPIQRIIVVNQADGRTGSDPSPVLERAPGQNAPLDLSPGS